jgi:hypothetical protein
MPITLFVAAAGHGFVLKMEGALAGLNGMNPS